jgi:BASS family bile acid:Na+ symporter
MISQELYPIIIKTGTFIAVLCLMFSTGLRMEPSHLMYFRGKPVLFLRSFLVVIILVPIAALLIIFLLHPSDKATAGLAILASSPAAPLMLLRVSKASGRLDYIASLHFLLSLLSIITTPVTLALMSKALGFSASVEPAEIAKLVLRIVILPVGLGLALKTRFPSASDRMVLSFSRFGWAVLLLMLLLISPLTIRFIFEMEISSYAAIIAFLVSALAVGHFSVPEESGERTALALEAAGRNPGFALVIDQSNFPPDKAVPFLIPYLVVFMALSAAYIVWRKRSTAKSGG